MRARYVGREAQTTTFDKTFYRGKWVNIDMLGAYAHDSLAQNPIFEIDGGEQADSIGPTNVVVAIDPIDPVV